ncbi:MAG: type III-B CRISPR-associated protein Cas10/Cmr2, partial [bacterium]|nr:type III-B CRISPR-associated protein Cas10/Cmr2 [bacterium]MDW8163507.1 type III-B CRISPR-associated protein Cas10/Cmr2 [Candidatus Omnitrophota bacterium]
DHSIWEHLKIISALNAFWDIQNSRLIQNNSLFLFTIGPVQSFVSQARKTQDFYMGSFILSYLTFKAMEVIIDKFGPTNIIYPDLYKQPLIDYWIKKNINIDVIGFEEKDILLPTIPNRFVAILETTDRDEILRLVENMKKNIREEIEEFKMVIFEELNIKDLIKEKGVEDKINLQLSEFPDIYWVCLPWKIDKKDVSLRELKEFFDESVIEKYEKISKFISKNYQSQLNIGLFYELFYSALEKSIGARKNLRNFNQVEEKGIKCSICGERDVIFFNEKNKKKFTRYNSLVIDLTEKIEKTPSFFKFLKIGEGLCSICFLKRTLEIYLEKKVSGVFKDLSFPSIAEISSSNFKENALKCAKEENLNYQNALQTILKDKIFSTPTLPKIKNLTEKNYDGQWFYEENLTEEFFEEELG